MAGNRFRLIDDQHEQNESCQRCDRLEGEDPTCTEGIIQQRKVLKPRPGLESKRGAEAIPAVPEAHVWLFHWRKLIGPES